MAIEGFISYKWSVDKMTNLSLMLTHNALFERMFFKLLLATDKYPLTGAKTCRERVCTRQCVAIYQARTRDSAACSPASDWLRSSWSLIEMLIRERGNLWASEGPFKYGQYWRRFATEERERGGQDSLPDRLQGDTAILFYGSQCHVIRYFSHYHHVIGVGDKINGSICYWVSLTR